VRWLLGAAAGFGLAFVAILGAIFLTGSTPADVYDGVITQALRIRTVNPAPIGIGMASLDWGIAAIAAVGAVGQGIAGHIDVTSAAIVGLPAVPGVLFGTWLQQRISTRTITLLFSIALAVISIELLIK